VPSPLHVPRRALALALGAVIVAGILPITAGAARAADAARPQVLGLTHYTGELHTHTGLTYPEQGGNLPKDVFALLESQGMDFYAAAEKSGGMDITGADAFIDDPRDAESDEWRDLQQEVVDWNAGGHDLVGVASQEVSWANLHSGHISTFNAPWLLAAESSGAGWNDAKTGQVVWDLPAFYARLKQDPDAIGQFNHPSPTGYGTFDDFHHLDRQLDRQMELFEYKQPNDEYLHTWWQALDAGWHVSPTWSGDDHGKGFNDNPARTGIWATEHSLDGLYDAMHRHSTYATYDDTAWISLTGNGRFMGSVLPSSTTSLDLSLHVSEPDDFSPNGTVTFYGNGGRVLSTKNYTAREADVNVTLPVTDGDWIYAQVKQADGDLLISAPLWIGDTVRGADYAPEISVQGPELRTAAYGQTIALPAATATDDSGATPAVTYEVFTDTGLVPIVDGAFTVGSYDDQLVVLKATDAHGNVGSELVRYTVDQAGADPETVFSHPEQIVNVGAEPGQAGISVATDQAIRAAYAQVRPVGAASWGDAIASTGRRAFDTDLKGRPGADWQSTVTDDVLRNHEFRLTGLSPGVAYEYRFARDPGEGWTGVRGTFTAGGFDDAPIYFLGDNQPPDPVQADYELFPQMLSQLRQQKPGGDLLVQVGDMVDNGGYQHQWNEAFQWSLKGLDLQYAGVVGNHESQKDSEKSDTLSISRNQIYSGMFANPLNGVIGESTYSFDRGDIHFAVLNSMYDTEAQLQWLIDDMRATDKTWKVVVAHFSYYGAEHAEDPGLVQQRAKVVPVLQQLGVDLYVSGHDHVYKRTDMIDGANAATDEEKLLGVNYVALGASGPKFYDDRAEPWDDVVFDEKIQTGMVLQATDAGLEVDAYAIDGRQIDHHVITQPTGYWKVTSSDIRGGKLNGIGITSYPGAPDGDVTVTVGVYDATETTLLDLRTATVRLKQRGGEQLVRLDRPLALDTSTRVKAFVWDGLGTGRPLQPQYVVQEGLTGSGTAEDPYRVRNAEDLANVSQNLAAHYLLTDDIVFDSVDRATIGTAAAPFTGVLDGGGHAIRGIVTSHSGAMGVIGTNKGTIRNLGVEDAALNFNQKFFGVLADINLGTIERVHTTGSIYARAQIGGITGQQQGVVRDSWSTVSVTAQTRGGGIAGSAMYGSVTERTWFGGSVTMIAMGGDTAANGGGITGYAEAGSTVRDNVVLEARITGKNSQAVAGQLDTAAVFGRNLVSSETEVGGPQRATAVLKGTVVPESDTETEALYTGLGWDLTTVWLLDPVEGRPSLIAREG
jgi:large repetitive protein